MTGPKGDTGDTGPTGATGPGASPAGVSSEIQYRDGGAFGAASKALIGSTGNLLLVGNTAQPTPPPTGRLQLYARRRAGADFLEIQRPNGREIPLSPHFGFNRIATWSPSTGTTVVVSGMPRTAVGTVSTPSITTTNFTSSIRRWRVTGAATAFAGGDERSPAALCWRGNNVGLGGFTYTNRFSLVTLSATARGFFGLYASVSALSQTAAVDVKNLANAIGMAFDNATDANWQIVHRANTGAAAVVDLGPNFPVNNMLNVYTLVIYAEANGTEIGIRVINETTGAVVEYTASTLLPQNTALFSVRNFMTNGGTAVSIAYECSSVYLETDY